jgi:DNA end-binding protein Ku
MGRVLAMSTMLFADEVVDAAKMSEVPAIRTKPAKREIDMAERLVASLTSKWNPRKYKDTYERELRQLIEQKRKGKQVTAPSEPEEPENVLDLMAALEASLQGGGRGRRAPASRAAAKKAPAKRSTARKTTRSGKPATKKAAAPRKQAAKRTTRRSAA